MAFEMSLCRYRVGKFVPSQEISESATLPQGNGSGGVREEGKSIRSSEIPQQVPPRPAHLFKRCCLPKIKGYWRKKKIIFTLAAYLTRLSR